MSLLGRRLFTGVAAALALLAAPLRAQAPAPIDLGTLGGPQSFADRISDTGVVIGASHTIPNDFGNAFSFAWTASGGMVPVALNGAPGHATGISLNGVVTGWSHIAASGEDHGWVRTVDGGYVDLGADNVAQGVSLNGIVFGTNASTHAFIWTPTGGMQDLGDLGGAFSNPWSISANGSMVVGYSQTPTGIVRAFAWTSGGGIVDLEPGGPDSYAVGASNTGVVAVNRFVGGPDAAVWRAATGMVSLGTLGGGYSEPHAVSANGVVIGLSANAAGQTHGFAWSPTTGGLVDLTLGGSQSGVAAVNPSGMVVGSSDLPGDTEHHAFIWTEAGGIVDLGALPGASDSRPSAVNAHGVVVGTSGDHAFAWSEATGMVDLGTTGGSESRAFAINNNGLIGGMSENAAGEHHAAVWTLRFAFNGFFQPVDAAPTLNTVKAGAAVPLKFGLGGYYGLKVLAAGSPTSTPISCSSSAPLDEIEQTVTAGESSLTYDTTSGQYVYVWKTSAAWKNTCRQLTLRLTDGTDHTAMFKLK